MGLFDRFFPKKKEEEEKIAVASSELAGFIQGMERNQKEQLFRDAKPVLEDIASLMEAVIEDIESIASAETPDNTPDRIKSIIKTTKPVFVKAFADSCRGLDEVPDMDGLEIYRKKLDDFISSAPKIILGQGRYLHYPFNEDLEKLRNDLRPVFEGKKSLDELMKDDAFSGVADDSRAFLEGLSRIKSLESEEKSLMRTIKAKEAAETALKERYEGIEGASSFKEYEKNRINLEGKIKEKESSENELFNLATPIKKSIKVAVHSLGDQHPPEISRKDLLAYSDNPVKELLSHGIDERRVFFSHLKDLLKSMEHKGDKLDKAISKIDEAGSPETEERIQKILRLNEEERRLSALIDQSPYLREKSDLGRNLEQAKRELRAINEEHEKIKKKIAETSEGIRSLRTRLEEKLSRKTGKKVSLEL